MCCVIIIVAVQKPPKCCNWCWIAAYVLLLVCLVISASSVGVLYFIPSPQEYDPLVYPNETILLPVHPDPLWLSTVNIIAGVDCWGQFELYEVFSDDPESCVNNDHSYQRDPTYCFDQEHIYCLDGSVFNFSLKYPAEEVWVGLFDDSTMNPEINCASAIQCIQLNSSHMSDTITVSTSEEGSFYSWKSWSSAGVPQVEYHVNRRYYDPRSCFSTPINPDESPFPLHYRLGFNPADKTNNKFFLLSVYGSCNCVHGGITIQTVRRQDILMWPGLASGLIVLVIMIVVVVHLMWFWYKRHSYVVRLDQ